MVKILVEIINNSIAIDVSEKKTLPEKLLDTNIISHDKLAFSDTYIYNNAKIVSLFIRDLMTEKNINHILIKNNTILNIAFTMISKSNVTNLTLVEDKNLTYKACELILKQKTIKYLNCYSAPNFMIDLLDNKGIKTEVRSEILFASNFMMENNLSNYTNIYYKTSLRITPPLTIEDLDDFSSFCYINRYLKNIHFNKYDEKAISDIALILNKFKIKKIKFLIHENIKDIETAQNIKKLKKSLSSKYRITLKIVYSKEYIHENYLKQVTLATLKYCALLSMGIIFIAAAYVFVSNRISEAKTARYMTKINDILENTLTPPPASNTEAVYVSPLTPLLDINPDTVGWLQVNNTNIDYPVVQAGNKDYYLNYNFEKKKDVAGWIFMDPRNSKTSLDKNTIIYGHNRFNNGVMFGTLGNVLKKSWYTNEENLIITFNTLYGEFKWKIFAIYPNPSNGDYLITSFASDEEFNTYLNMVKERSIYAFTTEVTQNDKILTLSTCLDNYRRLVVQAVLLDNQ